MSLAELSLQKLSIGILKHLFDFLYLRFGQELIFSRPSEDSARAHAAIFDAVKSRDTDTATRVLKKPEFSVTLHLNLGEGRATMLTCDFSLDYVKINADYRS